MTLNTREIQSTSPIGESERTVRPYYGSSSSLRRAFWQHRLQRIRNRFDGGTSANEEADALATLLLTDSGAEARHYIREIRWDRFDDEFEEAMVSEWARHAGVRLAAEENRVARLVRSSLGSTTDVTIEQQTQRYRSVWGELSASRRQTLAQQLASDRSALIESAIGSELRDRPSRLDSFQVILEVMLEDAAVASDALLLTRWQAHYAPRFAEQLSGGEVRLLVTTLGDLVDPTLAAVQRRALFELYRALQPDFEAIRDVIGLLGNADMVQRYQRFLEARRVFMDAFPSTEVPPGLIRSLINLLGGVGDRIADLQAVLADIGGALTGVTLDGILDGVSDDLARNAINDLTPASRIGLLPLTMRTALCRLCLAGTTDDDDEQAIHRVIANPRGGSLAERYLMVAALTWEALAFSFDGDEYDRLEELLSDV